MKSNYSPQKILPTLEDLPSNKPNCGNCTRKSNLCIRSKNDKTQHNGYLISSLTGEIIGMITGCPHYTGTCGQLLFNFSDYE